MTGAKSDDRVDVEALEDTMDEVLETLAVAEQAAAFMEANSAGPEDRSRANAVRRQVEAMLDAADEAVNEGDLPGEDGDGFPDDPVLTSRPTGTSGTLH